ADWIRVVCFPDRWLDLRYVGPSSSPEELLRGIVARRGRQTVVALRNAQLVTFTAMDINDPRDLAPVLGAGLTGRAPARFPEFSMPARVGARADERLRAGTALPEVLEYLGIPRAARPVVESVFTGPRSYVEIVAGQRRDGRHDTTEVGMSIVDATAGRVLVSPSRAFDGEWVSTFSPGTPLAIATAVDHLTDLLPDGRWFPEVRLARDFSVPHT
ncbi:ESX secretion-associated protein EspG, partial [Mycobacterium sp. 1274756.6]|uniref:ESX secretion-associated protein EspG n=1 Tax=Mycobacterium sp. 1274756.6 TaxID=1834076 RepID=UPI0007FC0781